MAAEISISGSLGASKEGLVIPTASFSLTPDWTNKGYVEGVQTIGTTYELIIIPAEVAALGWAIFKNLDTANYIELGLEASSTFYGFPKLLAGEWSGPVRLAMARDALFGRANTAAVDLYFRILRD